MSFDTSQDDFDDVNWGKFEDATGGAASNGKTKSNDVSFAVDFEDDTSE